MFLEMAYSSKNWYDFFVLLSANLLLIVFPIIWVIEYLYICRQKIELSKMIFGEDNPWALGKRVYLTDPTIFSGFLGMIAARWILEKWMKTMNWPELRIKQRRELMLESAIYYRHILTGDNYKKLKESHPMFLMINYIFLFFALVLIVCAVAAIFYKGKIS